MCCIIFLLLGIFLFFFFVVNIVVVVVRFLVTIADDSEILSTCCVSASVVEKREGSFEHLKRKKTTSSAWRSSRKKLRQHATHVPKKKCVLYTDPRSAAAVFLYPFFHSVFFFSLVSFFLSRVLCIFYYDDYPTHVMKLTRICSPYCCVVFIWWY